MLRGFTNICVQIFDLFLDKGNREHEEKKSNATDVLKTAAAAASRLRELKAKVAALASSAEGNAPEAKRDAAKRDIDPVHDLREKHAKACERLTRNPLFRPSASAAANLMPQQSAHAFRFIADFLQVVRHLLVRVFSPVTSLLLICISDSNAHYFLHSA